MGKVIKAVVPRSFGHVHLEFEDGSSEMVSRGLHETLKPGDVWPPEAVQPAVPQPAEEVEEVDFETESEESAEEDKPKRKHHGKRK